MSLDLSKLAKVRKIGEGYIARCPACAETGNDRSGQHLKIFPDGKFGCCVFTGDHLHRKRIFELAGQDSRIPVKPFVPRVESPPTPTINATKLMREFAADTPESKLCWMASMLGVSCASLRAYGWAWAEPHNAWAVPMLDGYGNPIGVRLRAEDGRKRAIPGSRQGLFMPDRFENVNRVWITEGATDPCAAHTLGLFSIGRPSCSGGVEQLKVAIRKLGCREAVLVSDADDPGINGAQRLANELRVPSVIICPPAKDLREFENIGGTREMLDSLVNSCVWFQPQKPY